MMHLKLTVLSDVYAICRLDPESALPPWAEGDFVSVTRTADELSIVCPQAAVPEDVPAERDWRCLQVEGPLDLGMVGVMASLVAPLAKKDVSVFVVSTFRTDYLMVKSADLEAALELLHRAGHGLSHQAGAAE